MPEEFALVSPRNLRPRRHSSQNRYDFACSRLADLREVLPSSVVFDIGCGDARMMRIKQYGLRWRGFDREAWRLAERWNLNEPCPVSEKAGAVLLLDVLACCVNPGLALQNISAAMQPGARLIFTDPNPHWSASRTYYLFQGWISSFRPVDVQGIGHYFTPWPHAVAALLEDAGLEIEDYVSLDGRTHPFRQRFSPAHLYPLRIANGLARAVIEALDPNAIGMSYALIARKK
jgi:SAM-dependent methyltransferase